LTDLFERASETVEEEKRLLGGADPRATAPPPVPAARDWPDSSTDLLQANAQYHPAALFPNTRAAGAKRLILRVLNVYTYRQILFNASVVRILNRWEPALRSLAGEAAMSTRRLTEWVNARIARLEDRRSLWEARLVGRVASVEDRTAATEADLAELLARARSDRSRLDDLEDSMRRLEALLERERDRATAGTPR
jgi:hypothetical protein